jgi:thiamine pyrophosphate-dependent acetolactate synthase large subunit-like protein
MFITLSEAGARVDVYAVANAASATDMSLGEATTRSELDAVTISGATFGASPLTMAVPAAGLPMSGVLKSASVTGSYPVLNISTLTLTRAVSKHNFLVHSADEIPETVAQAFYIATHGKPGPVVIDIPRDCQRAATSAEYPSRVALRAYHPEVSATTSQVNRFARLVNEAKRPVILAGGGVIASEAATDVARLARKAGIPVSTTLMGLGSFDETDPLALGLSGLHGEYAANAAIAQCDLLVALGVRFNDRVTGQTVELNEYTKDVDQIRADGEEVRISMQPEKVSLYEKESKEVLSC